MASDEVDNYIALMALFVIGGLFFVISKDFDVSQTKMKITPKGWFYLGAGVAIYVILKIT